MLILFWQNQAQLIFLGYKAYVAKVGDQAARRTFAPSDGVYAKTVDGRVEIYVSTETPEKAELVLTELLDLGLTKPVRDPNNGGITGELPILAIPELAKLSPHELILSRASEGATVQSNPTPKAQQTPKVENLSQEEKGRRYLEDKNTLTRMKIDGFLLGLYQEYAAFVAKEGVARQSAFKTSVPLLNVTSDGYVGVQAFATAGNVAILKVDLEGLGMRGARVTGGSVEGELPIDAIPEMEFLSSLNGVQATVRAKFRTGSVNSQGDVSVRANVARPPSGFVDGLGVPVGVISNSYNCKNGEAFGVASGEQPANVRVLKVAL